LGSVASEAIHSNRVYLANEFSACVVVRGGFWA
jgi:hypothetical protein